MKSIIKKIKDFYDAYKIIIWVLPICGGAVYDRFVNMWNVPTKLEEYRTEFIEQRKKDSTMFSTHVAEERIKNSVLVKEIYELKNPKKATQKYNSLKRR